MKKRVWAKIPRAGLANKILVWANALVFAKENNATLTVTNWVSIFIGPLLRGENSLRLYLGYFNQDSWLKRVQVRLLSKFSKVDRNTTADIFAEETNFMIFDTYMDWIVFFDRIREHRQFVKHTFFNQLLKKSLREAHEHFDQPTIGVHIRMGDFSKPTNMDRFNHEQSVSQQTPIQYFVEVINSLRQQAGKVLPVTVFSDGSKEELVEVLDLEKVQLSNKEKDIEDLLWLSKSKIIVTSATSTFSLFAAYLSDAIILHHPQFFIRPVRDTMANEGSFEGPFQKDLDLRKQLKKI